MHLASLRRRLCLGAAVALLALPAAAQGLAGKPSSILVVQAPVRGADLIARVYREKLQAMLGTPEALPNVASLAVKEVNLD